jgi:hypothetical protein
MNSIMHDLQMDNENKQMIITQFNNIATVNNNIRNLRITNE